MKIFRMVVWGFLALAPLATWAQPSPWPMAGGDRRHTGRSAAPLPIQADLKWHVPVGRFGYAGVIVGRSDGEDVVFGVSHDWEYGEKAFAVRETGQVLWETVIPDEPGADATPFLDESSGVLYFPAQDNSITAIQAATGHVLWKKPYPQAGTGQFITSSPTPGLADTFYLLQDTLLLGDRAGLVAVRMDGSPAWTMDLGPASHGEGAVAVDDNGGLVVVTTYALDGYMPAGRVVRLTPDGATILWDYRHSKPFPFFGTPAVDDDGDVYFGAQGQVGDWLGAVTATGTLKWENWEVSSRGSPAIGPDVIALIDDAGHLAVLDKETGQLRFRVAVGEGVDRNRAQPVTDRCGRVVAASTGGRIVAVDPTGEVLWEQTFEGQALSGPAVGSDGTLYVRAYGLYAFAGPAAPDCPVGPPDDLADEFSSPDGSADAGAEEDATDAKPVGVDVGAPDDAAAGEVTHAEYFPMDGLAPDGTLHLDVVEGHLDVPEVAPADAGASEAGQDSVSDGPATPVGSGGGCSANGAGPSPGWALAVLSLLCGAVLARWRRPRSV